MNDLERNVTVAIAEESILVGSRDWRANAEMIQLSAALRSDQDTLLNETLDSLKEQGLLVGWRRVAEDLYVELSDNFPLPDASPTEREKIEDTRIRRVLLFKLYDEHRRVGHKFARFSLAALAGSLRISARDVFRHVTHMEGDYLLKYGIGDGGQSTCHIEDPGIELCENREELFDRFSCITPVETGSEEIKPPRDAYVSEARISELERVSHKDFDLKRVIALCQEANVACANESWLSLAMIQRTLINHVPPIFGYGTFAEVVNNYGGGKSFHNMVQRLDESLRDVADMHLHQMIRARETLPERAQVDFRPEIDALLAEIVRILA